MLLRPLAHRAHHAHQALGHDAVQRGHKVIRLHAHVDEASDDVGDVVSVHGGEHQVAGKRRLNCDLGGFLIANFADHDFVRVVAQNRAETARERQTFLFVDWDLRDPAKLVFHRIFDGDDLVFVGFDFIHRGVQRGGFPGARGPGDQHHPVWLANIAAEAARLFRGKAYNVQRQALEFFRKRLLVQYAQHRIFAVARGHDRNAQVDESTLVFHAKTAVLRNAPFGNIQFAKHLDARKHRGMPYYRDGLLDVLESIVHAITAVLRNAPFGNI